MARKKSEHKELDKMEEKKDVEMFKPRFSPPKVSENKIKFKAWFPVAVKKHKEVKIHHMSGIKAFFESTGIGILNTPAAYEAGLKKYGYGRQ